MFSKLHSVFLVSACLVALILVSVVRAEHNGTCHLPDGPLIIYEDRFSQGWGVLGSWGGTTVSEVNTPGLFVFGKSLLVHYPNAWNGTGLYADNLNAFVGDKDALVLRVRKEQGTGDIRVGFHRSTTNTIDMRIPRQNCHRFQANPATDSTATLPPVPHESCH